MKDYITNYLRRDNRVQPRKKARVFILNYVPAFLLFLGYSLAVSSSIKPIFILDKSNISIYAFGDLFFIIFGDMTTSTLLLILFFLSYRSFGEMNSPKNLRRDLMNRMANVAVYIIILYLSVFLSYVFTLDKNVLNFGFSDRSPLTYIIPAHYAILLSFLFHCFYIITFLLIAMIVDKSTKKSWLAIIISIALSHMAISIRTVFQSKNFIGMLPGDNVSIFYLSDLFYGIKRPSYIFSLVYWILLIFILCIVLFLANKVKNGNSQ